jgi:Domain of Unknown Function (DUF1206)
VLTERDTRHDPGSPAATEPVRHARRGGERLVRSDSFEWLARAGFVARGVVYLLIGVLAIELALGVGGSNADQQGALRTIARQPLGTPLLILVAAGLGGYALWRFVRALLGHGREDSDGALDRLAALGSGVVYAGLCALAVEIVAGSGKAGQSHRAAAGVLGWPAGAWLVGAAGIVLVGVGLYQGYRAFSKDFLEDSKTEEMSPRVRRWVEWIGVFGHLSRMVVYALVGVFLFVAAVTFNPKQAVGLDGALARLAHQSYGPLLLAIVACGLVAFGAYSLSDARYRRI